MIPRNPKGLLKTARQHLVETGWSQRRAAPELGVKYTHLAKVMANLRVSRALLEKILTLGPCPRIPAQSPYAKQTKKTDGIQAEREQGKLL